MAGHSSYQPGKMDMDMGMDMDMDGMEGMEGMDMGGMMDMGGTDQVQSTDPFEAKLCIGKVYELYLTAHAMPGGTASPNHRHSQVAIHPYHHHVNHFQIYDIPPALRSPNGLLVREGEWRDIAPAAGVSIRFYTADFSGDVMMHCHILQHEDHGMMGIFTVRSGANCGSCSGPDCVRPY